MSAEKVINAEQEKLLLKIWEDDAFAQKLAEIKEMEPLLKFLHENGVNMNEQDATEMVEIASKINWAQADFKGKEIPDEMLENVAGGSKVGDFLKDFGKGFAYGFTQPAKALKQLFTGDFDGMAQGVESVTGADFVGQVTKLVKLVK